MSDAPALSSLRRDRPSLAAIRNYWYRLGSASAAGFPRDVITRRPEAATTRILCRHEPPLYVNPHDDADVADRLLP